MGVLKKENKLKKMEQRRKALEKTNPKMAETLAGKMAGLNGKKSV